MTFIADDIKEYERLKVEAKELQERIEHLGESILSYMDQEGAEETPVLPLGGKIVVSTRQSWIYSPDIEKEKAELDKHMALEEVNGKATAGEDTKYLIYKSKSKPRTKRSRP